MSTLLDASDTEVPEPGLSVGTPTEQKEHGRDGRVITLVRSRAALTVFDQALSSASNFAVAVVVARLSGANALGIFSVAYAVWLFVASLHRSLVTDPMAIEGDARSPEARRKLRTGLSADLLLGITGSVACALLGLLLGLFGQGAFGSALISVSPWLVGLVVQDYWRWAGFMSGRPGRSLANDAVFALVQALLFGAIFLTVQSPTTAIVVGAWGLSALVAALFGVRQFRFGPATSGAWTLLRSRWQLSRWLVGHDLSLWGTSQGTLVLSGILLGPTALGGLKAAQALVSGPALVLIQAGGSVGLPEASQALAEQGQAGLRRVTRRVTFAAAGGVLLITLLVAVMGSQLMTAIYGPSFGSLHIAATLFGVGYTIGALGLGSILALKALRLTRPLVVIQLITFAVLVCVIFAFTRPFGANGTAASTVVANIVFCHLMFRAERLAEGRSPSSMPRWTRHPPGRHRRP